MEIKDQILQVKKDLRLNLSVPKRLTSPHPYIQRIRKNYIVKKPGYRAVLVSPGFGELSISVAPKNVRRALCLLDCIVKMLEARGHKILIEREATFLTIGDEKVFIRLVEKRKRIVIQDKWTSWDFEATGRLKFQYGISWNRKELLEGKVKLEDQLPKILALLEMHAEHEKQEGIRIREYWQQQNEKNIITQNLQKRKEAEFDLLSEHLLKANRYRIANVLRDYAKAIDASRGEKSIQVAGWVYKKADWYDPLIELEDCLLEDGHRHKLDKEKFRP